MRYIDKLLHMLWLIIKFILVLLIYPTIALIVVAVGIFFSISIDILIQVVLGSLLILIGIYGICVLRHVLKKSKLLTIIFGWIGPACAGTIGISIILNNVI